MGTKKAVFFVDALISAVMAMLLLSLTIDIIRLHTAATYDFKVSNSAALLMLSSNKAVIATSSQKIGEGPVCILRVYHGIRRVCGEVI